MTTLHPEHVVVRTDDESRVVLEGAPPRAEFVVLRDTRGGTYFIPLDHLHESEQAVFRNAKFLQDTIAGLEDVAAGRVKTLDWVLDYANQ